MWIVRLALRRPYTFVVMALLIVVLGVRRDRPHADRHLPGHRHPGRQRHLVVHRHLAGRDGAAHRASSASAPSPRPSTTSSTSSRSRIVGVGVIKHLLPARRQDRGGRRAGHRDLADDAARRCRRACHAAAHRPLQRLQRADPAARASPARRCPSSSSSTTRTNFVRTQLATVQGASRAAALRRQAAADHGRSRSRRRSTATGLSPSDVVNAINAQNLILPAGTAKIGDARVQRPAQQQPGHRRGAQRPADQAGQRRDRLHPGRRPGARRLRGADQHRAPGRPPRRAADRPQERRRLDARRRAAGQGHAAAASRPRCRRSSRSSSLFDQSIFVRAAIDGVRQRGDHRRRAHRADDPAVPRQLAQHADRRASRFRCRS